MSCLVGPSSDCLTDSRFSLVPEEGNQRPSAQTPQQSSQHGQGAGIQSAITSTLQRLFGQTGTAQSPTSPTGGTGDPTQSPLGAAGATTSAPATATQNSASSAQPPSNHSSGAQNNAPPFSQDFPSLSTARTSSSRASVGSNSPVRCGNRTIGPPSSLCARRLGQLR